MRTPIRNSTRTSGLLLVMSVWGIASVFCESLGITKFISEEVMLIVLAAIAVALVFSRRLDLRRARLSPQVEAGTTPVPRSLMWIVIGICAAVALSGPFWLPLTGGEVARMSFTFHAVCSVTAFLIASAIIVYMFRRLHR